jgi:hypothetical protein
MKFCFWHNRNQRWINENKEDGWVYALARDDKKKHNECLVEWNKLSEESSELGERTCPEYN